MSLKTSFLVIAVIFILMTKLNTGKGRMYEDKYQNHRDLNKLNYHSFLPRHRDHYLHKKHHKCAEDGLPYEKSVNGKKPSRYPTLDKIVHRLDHRVDKPRSTTANPFDEWNVTAPVTTGFPIKSRAFAYYYAVGPKNGSSPGGRKVFSDGDIIGERLGKLVKIEKDSNEDLDGSNNVITEGNNNIYTKGFMQDYTTSSPWEKEQHDISSRVEERQTDTSDNSSTQSTVPPESSPDLQNRKFSFWSASRLLPKTTGKEDRKKQTTPMPYIAAHQHYEHVLRTGDCHLPKERVIRVNEVHPDPSKVYSPSCTILHQCADDTGCCRDLKQVCKPKNTTKVELYFFTTTLGKPQTVEKLNFVNHTECECQKRTEEAMPQDSEFRRHFHQQHHHHHHHQHRHHSRKMAATKPNDDKKKRGNCVCPSRFSVRVLQNETCVCDCFDKQDDCLVLKKGKSHFSYEDKMCIQLGNCLLPSCEFGSYIRQFGRCPNRSEKYHYRWSRILSYRDLIT